MCVCASVCVCVHKCVCVLLFFVRRNMEIGEGTQLNCKLIFHDQNGHEWSVVLE